MERNTFEFEKPDIAAGPEGYTRIEAPSPAWPLFEGEALPTADELLSAIETFTSGIRKGGEELTGYLEKIKNGTVAPEEKEKILSVVKNFLQYMEIVSNGMEHVNENIGKYEGLKYRYADFVKEYADGLEMAAYIQAYFAK